MFSWRWIYIREFLASSIEHESKKILGSNISGLLWILNVKAKNKTKQNWPLLKGKYSELVFLSHGLKSKILLSFYDRILPFTRATSTCMCAYVCFRLPLLQGTTCTRNLSLCIMHFYRIVFCGIGCMLNYIWMSRTINKINMVVDKKKELERKLKKKKNYLTFVQTKSALTHRERERLID